MRIATLILAVLPLPGMGEILDCRLLPPDGGAAVTLRFESDQRQFAPAISPDDPPRQLRSHVIQDGQHYVAEPFQMAGGVRGFWADDRRDGAVLLMVEADGAARMTDQALDQVLSGRCEAVK